ncbi:hypothetical protein Tco_0492223 [Tanacetum coccineum]
MVSFNASMRERPKDRPSGFNLKRIKGVKIGRILIRSKKSRKGENSWDFKRLLDDIVQCKITDLLCITRLIVIGNCTSSGQKLLKVREPNIAPQSAKKRHKGLALKARKHFLMASLNEHQLKFNPIIEAKSLLPFERGLIGLLRAEKLESSDSSKLEYQILLATSSPRILDQTFDRPTQSFISPVDIHVKV